jgi:hypothetical protein
MRDSLFADGQINGFVFLGIPKGYGLGGNRFLRLREVQTAGVK